MSKNSLYFTKMLKYFVANAGVEPVIFLYRDTKCSAVELISYIIFTCFLWRITDSNRWPPACKAGALASWANPPLCSPEQIWTADPYIISVVL